MSKYQAKSFKNSAFYAIRGLRVAFRTQRNVKKHFNIMLVMFLIAIILKFDCLNFAILFLASLTVIVTELFNSAIEFTLDAYYKNKFSNLVKMAKDISAGAVLLAACTNALVFALLIIDKILKNGLHFLT
ncbi:diacylglycerol kinase [bacterium]|nr:diacylglycerol kinase [bacterium]